MSDKQESWWTASTTGKSENIDVTIESIKKAVQEMKNKLRRDLVDEPRIDVMLIMRPAYERIRQETLNNWGSPRSCSPERKEFQYCAILGIPFEVFDTNVELAKRAFELFCLGKNVMIISDAGELKCSVIKSMCSEFGVSDHLRQGDNCDED